MNLKLETVTGLATDTRGDAAFFEISGDNYIARSHARSPWDPGLVHGRLLAGLMARSIELDNPEPDLHPSRMTIDLFRPIPMAPITITTTRRREGRRLRVVEATATVGSVPVGWASTLFLVKSEHPNAHPWSPEPWPAPAPLTLPEPPKAAPPRFGELRRVETASATGSKFAWFRETRDLVAGESSSPFTLAAAAADWVSPLANSAEGGLAFINADISLYLSRLPRSSWIGFETTGHDGADGIAVSRCSLYDVDGRIGFAAAAAMPYPHDQPHTEREQKR